MESAGIRWKTTADFPQNRDEDEFYSCGDSFSSEGPVQCLNKYTILLVAIGLEKATDWKQ